MVSPVKYFLVLFSLFASSLTLPAEGLATLGYINHPSLPEVSGIDLAHRPALAFWVLNDSGNPAQLLGLDQHGKLQIEVALPFQNVDWEDVSTFELDHQAWVLVADIGDNLAYRQHLTLYLFKEPQGQTKLLPKDVVTLNFVYDNGPRDAESVAVCVKRKEIWILSKREEIPAVYVLPLQLESSTNILIAHKMAKLNTLPQPSVEDPKEPFAKFRSQPTAMDYNETSERLAVLTYQDVYIFKIDPSLGVKSLEDQAPVRVGLPPYKFLPQRESLCWGTSGNSLIITSEGVNVPLIEVEVGR